MNKDADTAPDDAAMTAPATTTLISGNVRINGRRTSVRLEAEMWDALQAVSRLEGVSVNDLCTAISEARGGEGSFSSAVRVYLLEYFRIRAAQSEARDLALVTQRAASRGAMRPFQTGDRE